MKPKAGENEEKTSWKTRGRSKANRPSEVGGSTDESTKGPGLIGDNCVKKGPNRMG